MHFLVVTSALGCAVGYPVLASFEAHVEKRGEGYKVHEASNKLAQAGVFHNKSTNY